MDDHSETLAAALDVRRGGGLSFHCTAPTVALTPADHSHIARVLAVALEGVLALRTGERFEIIISSLPERREAVTPKPARYESGDDGPDERGFRSLQATFGDRGPVILLLPQTVRRNRL